MFTAALSTAAKRVTKHGIPARWNRGWALLSCVPLRLHRPRKPPGRNTGALPFSRGSSQPRDGTLVCRMAGRFFTSWAAREALVEWNEGLFQWNTPQSWQEWSPDTCYSVMSTEKMTLSEGWQIKTPPVTWSHLYEIGKARTDKCIETERRWADARAVGWGFWEERGVSGYQWVRGFLSGEKVLDWRAVTVAELCKYTKKHWVVYRKGWIITL